jgi:YbbR domain-containing protein
LPWKRWSENLGAKLLSLVAAVALWLSVTNEIEFEKTLTFPVEYVNLPEGTTPVRELPAEVRARIRARGKFLAYRLRGGVCRVDLSRHTIGISNVAVDGANLVLPTDVAVAHKEVVEPRTIALELDELVLREIAINAPVIGEPARGFVRVGKTAIDPLTAKVSGPRRFVDEIGLISTQPIDIERDRSTLRKRVRLVPPGPATVTVEPAVVEVGITIEALVERDIPGVVLEVAGAVPEGLRLDFRPATLSVQVSGARSMVDVAAAELSSLKVPAESLHVWVPGTRVLEIGELVASLPLPSGVEVRGVEPDRVVLTIARETGEGGQSP